MAQPLSVLYAWQAPGAATRCVCRLRSASGDAGQGVMTVEEEISEQRVRNTNRLIEPLPEIDRPAFHYLPSEGLLRRPCAANRRRGGSRSGGRLRAWQLRRARRSGRRPRRSIRQLLPFTVTSAGLPCASITPPAPGPGRQGHRCRNHPGDLCADASHSMASESGRTP